MTRLPPGSITSKLYLSMPDLDPIGPSKLTLSKAYTTPGKPASKQPTESHQTLGKTVEDVGRHNELDGEQIADQGKAKSEM